MPTYTPTALLGALVLTTALAAPATPALSGAIWVADEAGSSLTVIDAATNKVRTTLTGVPAPHNVQLAPDGKSAWAVLGENAQAVKIDSRTERCPSSTRAPSSP